MSVTLLGPPLPVHQATDALERETLVKDRGASGDQFGR